MRGLVLATLLLTAGVATANAQCFSGFSPQAVADALVERGYRAGVEITEEGDPVIRMGMQGNDSTSTSTTARRAGRAPA
jgi:hypothetical protein